MPCGSLPGGPRHPWLGQAQVQGEGTQFGFLSWVAVTQVHKPSPATSQEAGWETGQRRGPTHCNMRFGGLNGDFIAKHPQSPLIPVLLCSTAVTL